MAAAMARQAALLSLSSTRVSSRCICPSVSVPVLSKIRSLAPASDSIAWPRVTIRLCLAISPVATVSATGVASDSAHGQVTTSTDTAIHSARDGSICIHSSAAVAASSRMAPTNQPAARCVSSIQRGRSPDARSIRLTMAASAVSLPTRVTRRCNALPLLTDPPISAAPAVFATGRLSPLSSASLRVAPALSSTPSAGSVSPGRTSKRSPGRSRALATVSVSSSASALQRLAVSGASRARCCSVLPARWRASSSR